MRKFALAALIGWVLSRLMFFFTGWNPATLGDTPLVWVQDLVVWTVAYGVGFLIARRVWSAPSVATPS